MADKKTRPVTLYVASIETPADFGYQDRVMSIDIEITAIQAGQLIEILNNRKTDYEGNIRLRFKGHLVL